MKSAPERKEEAHWEMLMDCRNQVTTSDNHHTVGLVVLHGSHAAAVGIVYDDKSDSTTTRSRFDWLFLDVAELLVVFHHYRSQ